MDKVIRKVLKKLKIVILPLFHILYYNATQKAIWLGTEAMKNPLDMWIYQEIIFETKPDLIIETGTAFGGSAKFLANICDLIGQGQVVTIDIDKKENRPTHSRINYILGSSTSDEVVNQIKKLIKKEDKILVILDSDHSKPHVLKELTIYSQLVSIGSYMVVEDTNLNGHPVWLSFGPGPMEALREFLKKNKNFKSDWRREKFMLTYYPQGFLKRIK